MSLSEARLLLVLLVCAGSARAASQKISEKGDTMTARYTFENFNGDDLELSFQIKKAAYQTYDAEWGYTDKDLDALKTWQKKARQDAFNAAVKAGKDQAGLDADLAKVGQQYKKKQAEYFGSRGFLVSADNTVTVDIPALVRRNIPLMKPLAEDLDALAKKNKYGSMDTVSAAAAMLQTALEYRQPPPLLDGKHTGGVLPPPVALVKGWGDCDTKTATLAAILKNYSSARLIGVAVPGHYLVGVLASPNKGDMFMEHDGQRYILIEPAGPGGLPPGNVAPETADMIGSADFKIEPFN